MKLRYKILNVLLALVIVAAIALRLVASYDSPCPPSPALAASAAHMKAVMYRCYGTPQVLKLEDVAKPVPADDELLVKVHAASLNPLDWHYMSGTPYIVRLLDSGIGAPKDPRMGVDFSGTVEAVGRSVEHFKVGDEVFGGRDGAFAEYLTVRESRAVVVTPQGVSFEQAAALPIAAITALQALRDKGKLRAGQKVLINGASGGVGTFSVQLAKWLGGEVTGVCSTKNVELVRSLGADHVIDYTREDFTRGAERYDLIIDNVGSHPLLDYRRVMTPHGVMVIVGGPNSRGQMLGGLTFMLTALILNPFVSQRFAPFLAELNPKDLSLLAGLIQQGKLKPVIDRRYPLAQLPEAMSYLEAGHARGKIVIDVLDDTSG
jgi:NADPH:quinone reductase-like Zn-dependent oxidoreductase